jgi:uronate dehydrogenase
VLDEPTNHLAAAIVHRILDSLRALPDAPAILVVSHDPLPAAAKGKVSAGTGAVARLVVPLLEQRGYTLRLADRAGTGAEQVGLRDADVCARAVAGVDGIVHLAGAAKEASLESLVADNAVALGHLLAAASRAGVPHFVLASSMHVMGMYGRLDRFDEDAPPRPDSHYAASKLHGEALCRVYHEKSGLTVACLRLGSVTAKEADSDPGAWFSPEDVVQLIELAFALPRPSFEVFHAVADYDGGPLPPSRAARYGYACQRPGGPYAAVLDKVQRWWHSDEWARTRRGGSFAADDL